MTFVAAFVFLRSLPIRAFGLAMLVVVATTPLAQASVLQLVNTGFTPGVLGTPPAVFDTDDVFVPTSGDVTTNIFAGIGGTGSGSPGYFANASAGIFGDVGLNAGAFGVGQGSQLGTEVVIGSDEFVNVSGRPVNVEAAFIVDGGFIQDFFTFDTTVTFILEVGAQNLGVTGPETDSSAMEVATRQAAGFGGAGGFFSGYEGGRYTATYSVDANRNRSFSDTVEGGLDLGATFNPTPGPGDMSIVVDIPFSLQTLDLGTMLPGDRLLLGYVARIEIEQDGISEGIYAGFSDPLQLSNNGIRNSLTFTPVSQTVAVPAPASLPVMAAGLVGLGFVRRRCRQC